MNSIAPATLPAEAAAFLEELFAEGLLLPSGVDGLHGRGPAFEAVVEGLDGLITRMTAADGAERMRFPPGMPRRVMARSGYLKSFPQLAGTVHCFCGDERAHARLLAAVAEGEEWAAGNPPSEIALTPAACYPVYPALAARGAPPAEGWLVDVASWCFRHEPSRDPMRMQMFRMREQVRVGTPTQVLAFRERWLERARDFAASLGLPASFDVANDPFFGRAGRIMAESQREAGLKFELLIPVTDPARPSACMSFNYHQDHFGTGWGIEAAPGVPAHTACVGWGMERLALALLKHHGPRPGAWPAPVRSTLGLG